LTGKVGCREFGQIQFDHRTAKLGLSTIVDFEKSRRSVSGEAVEMIRHALEQAGIEFIDENGNGPGVRLHKHPRPKM
jgi:hypothetical protein